MFTKLNPSTGEMRPVELFGSIQLGRKDYQDKLATELRFDLALISKTDVALIAAEKLRAKSIPFLQLTSYWEHSRELGDSFDRVVEQPDGNLLCSRVYVHERSLVFLDDRKIAIAERWHVGLDILKSELSNSSNEKWRPWNGPYIVRPSLIGLGKISHSDARRAVQEKVSTKSIIEALHKFNSDHR